MGNKDSTKQQIIKKLMLTPQRLAELEAEKTERTWAHERLKDPDDKVKLLFDRVFDCRVMIDERGGIVYANEAACMVLGYAKEQLLKLSAKDLYPDEETEKMQAAAIRVLRDGVDYVGETEFIAKNGEMITVEAGAVSLKLADRSYITCSFRDITERKRLKDDLRESEERLEAFIENAPDAIHVHDLNGVFLYGNKKAEELVGYSREELYDSSFLEVGLLPEEYIAKTAELLEKSRRGERTGPDEMELIRKDGSRIKIEISSFLVQGSGRSEVVNIARDITQRKRADEVIVKDSAIASSLNAIALADLEDNLTYVNPSFLSMWGYDDEKEVVGRSVIEFWQAPQQVAEVVIETLSEKEGWQGELIAVRRDGSVFVAQLSANMVVDDDGKPICMMGSFADITERKRLEEMLRESESLSRGILESATVGMYIVQDGKFQYVNPQFEQITGYRRDELLGADSMEHIHPDDSEMVRQKAIEHLKGQSTLPYEYRFESKDGGILWILERVASIQYKGRLATMGSFMDINERKCVEEALGESQKFFSGTLNKLLTFVGVMELDGKAVFVNNTALEAAGIEPEDVIGKVLYDTYWWAYSKEARQTIKKDIERCASGETFVREIQVQMAGGSLVWIEFSMHPIYDEEGEVKYLVPEGRDITDHKQGEEALRKSENKFRTAIESARDGIAMIDIDSSVVDINRTLLIALGCDSKEQVIGKSALEFLVVEQPQELQDGIQQALAKKGHANNLELMGLTRDGIKVPVEINISQMSDEEGQTTGAIIVIRNIAKRKQAQEEIICHSKRVEALHAIIAVVIQTLDLDEMLNSALEKVIEVIEVDAGCIHFLDVEKKELVLRVHRGLSEQYVAAIERLGVGEEAVRRWLEHTEPAFGLRGILTEPVLEATLKAADKEGIGTFVAVPLWSRNVMWGGLGLSSHTSRRFSTEELELLKSIGNEVAVGIENARLLEKTRELSITDELTGLYNRRHFYEVLEAEMERTQRYGRSFSVAMLDLDGFKQYNDRFGHTNGDAALKSLGERLKSSLRKVDRVFRYGGDEFTIILPSTEARKAKKIIDRIKSEWLEVPKAENLVLESPLGFSAGIAQFPENAETADGLVFLADAALYHSKREGGYKSTLVSNLGEVPASMLGSATMDQVYALSAMVDAKDPHTYGHSKRVAAIVERIGKAIKLPPKELADLRAAALLHDIGKVGVPDAILTKPDKLVKHEWKIIRTHPVEGAKIVGYVRELVELVPIIRHHHEWYDGTGYPDGLKGEDIPLGARIISIADAYDTMTTQRPYRDVVSQEEALAELSRCSGTQFDSQLVETFCRAVNEDIEQDAGKMKSPSLVPK